MKLSYCIGCIPIPIAVLSGLLGVDAVASVLHVTPAGDDANSGAAWDESKLTITQALAAASAGDEIWVAAGRYGENIEMKPGVALYGGFAGTETARDDRDWVQQLSVLDGGTNGIVVLIAESGPDTVVDGFTIRNGMGSGVRLYNSAAILRNNMIRDNMSSASVAYGAGISIRNVGSQAVATIDRNVIVENYAHDGGGIACIDASPRITRNVIAWNFAQQNGGGISCWRDSSPLIANNVISGNTSFTLDGVAVPVGGGGIFATADDLDGRPHPTATSAPRIRNNVIVANGGKSPIGMGGGGISLSDSNGGVPEVVNNTIVANNGAGIHWGSSALPGIALLPVLRNNLIAYNAAGLEMMPGTPDAAIIEFNCVHANQVHKRPVDWVGLIARDGIDGNFSADPRLANFKFAEFHLQPDSPCIDTGMSVPGTDDWLDIDEQPRVANAGIDIGADESFGELWPVTVPRFHVRPDGDDAADGRSWSTAKRTVQSAIHSARLFSGEVWVAAGTYVEHVSLPAFVYLYGGFAGTELDHADRDPQAHVTILDGGGVPNVVVSLNGGYQVSTVDGFTIRGGGVYTGALSGPDGVGGNGGGVMLLASSPMIANNLITLNSLSYDSRPPTLGGKTTLGAGIYLKFSYAAIANNTIQDNEIRNDLDGRGGAVYCTWSTPLIQGNLIQRNHAKYGAAIYSEYSSPLILHNQIQSNSFYHLPPLYKGSAQGALTLIQNTEFLIDGNLLRGHVAEVGAAIDASNPSGGRIQNNLILDNRANDFSGVGGIGGAIHCSLLTPDAQPVWIVHNTLAGNIASGILGERGGGIAFVLPYGHDQLVIANNILSSNSSGIYQVQSNPSVPPVLAHNNLFNTHSNYINIEPGATDLSFEPGFVGNDDWRLAPDSPGIDAGTNLYSTPADRTGVPRPLDGNNDGVPAPDLGAFETIHSEADSDSDGMPDVWELGNGLNPVLDDAALDTDGDRTCNLHEYLAGTDPQDLTSCLALEVTATPGADQVTLRWHGVSGRLYTLERTEILPGPISWEPMLIEAPGTDQSLEWRESVGTAANRFYRVQAKF